MKASLTGLELLLALVVASLLTACATPAGPTLRQQHEAVRQDYYAPGEAEPPAGLPPEPMTPSEYLQLAFKRNPDLRAAFDRWQAALERVPQARAWEDPALNFEYFIEQISTRYQASLVQSFPAFGTLSRREGQAAAEAQAAMHAFDAERFDLIERVLRAVQEYAYLARETEFTEENVHLLAGIESVVNARYQSGAAPFDDQLKVQIELARMADRLAALHAQRGVQSAELAALLDGSFDELLPWPKVVPSDPAPMETDFLGDLLAELNPELKAAAAEIEAARLGRDLARRSGWPGFMLGASWEVMPGEGNMGDESDVGLMAGITLPIWRGRIRAGFREADAMLQAATHERDGMRNRLRTELSMAIFDYRDAERRIDLYRNSLVPKAETALAVAQQAYTEGRTDFAAWVDAQRTLLEFRLMAERAMADREIALADIGCCIGSVDIAIGN